jgi:hypothetical protein
MGTHTRKSQDTREPVCPGTQMRPTTSVRGPGFELDEAFLVAEQFIDPYHDLEAEDNGDGLLGVGPPCHDGRGALACKVGGGGQDAGSWPSRIVCGFLICRTSPVWVMF